MISVIVPVYNISLYLDKCIQSIISQSYSELQIIIVDDGSTDESSAKCDEWASMDDRVQVIHKLNGGVSSARNAGLDMAKGEYISFIDGDDWLDEKMYESLLQSIEKNNCDGAFCGFNFVGEDGTVIERISPKESGIVSAQTALANIVSLADDPNYQVAAWNKLFKRELIEGNRFDTNLTYGEDGLFTISSILKGTSIYLEPQPMYNYLIREGSATHTVGLTRQRIDNVRAWSQIKTVLSSKTPIQQIAEIMMCRVGMPILVEAYCEKREELVIEMQSLLDESKKMWLDSEYTSMSTRIKYKTLNMLIKAGAPISLVDKIYKTKR